MEQLNITATKDNDKVYKILGDLMDAGKEFQIMITVPSTGKETSSVREIEEPKLAAPVHDLEQDVTDMIHEIGVPAHIKGYQYLREAVLMVLDNRDVINRITKELYPGIARRFDTSASKVERAMRHAIEVAWSRGRLDTVNKMYGYKVFDAMDKPTNGEFISCVAEKIGTVKSA